MEKLLLGGKRKARDDQSTCRAKNSTPILGHRDVLILEEKGHNVALVRKKAHSMKPSELKRYLETKSCRLH
jgi:hypothetical protein